jgi:hypothetical protein
MNLSSRHHYLPIFYLNGFTDDLRQFSIYDVEQSRFIKNKKKFSPTSYFFEHKENSIFFDNVENDYLETNGYGRFDTLISELLDKVRKGKSENQFNVSSDDMPLLQFFMYLLYWRLPSNRKKLTEQSKDENLSLFGLKIVDQDGIRTEKTIKSEQKFLKDVEFRKNLKYFKAVYDGVNSFVCTTKLKILSFQKGLPSVCSDSPIIFKNQLNPTIYNDDYILPLSGDIIFLRSNTNIEFPISFKILVDTLVYKQANKYVSFSDPTYKDVLDKFYNNNFKSTEHLRTYIFENLNEKDS